VERQLAVASFQVQSSTLNWQQSTAGCPVPFSVLRSPFLFTFFVPMFAVLFFVLCSLSFVRPAAGCRHAAAAYGTFTATSLDAAPVPHPLRARTRT
jgi:hypothetical protein